MRKLSAKEMLIRRLEIIPVKVVIRNNAAGRICQTFGLKDGQEFRHPIIEHYLKNPQLGNPLLNDSHISAFGIAAPEELQAINRVALRANAILKSYFERRDLRLVDFGLEFGRYNGQILVGDEISLDTCRLFDLRSNELIGEWERIRSGSRGLREAYIQLRDTLVERQPARCQEATR